MKRHSSIWTTLHKKKKRAKYIPIKRRIFRSLDHLKKKKTNGKRYIYILALSPLPSSHRKSANKTKNKIKN